MSIRVILHLALCALLGGCALQKMYFVHERPQSSACTAAAAAPQKIDAAGNDFFVWYYQGKYYVIGTPETNSLFVRQHLLPASESVENAGPYGETVIFEKDDARPDLLARLQEQYRNTPKLLKHWADEYFVWKHHDRIYVIGDRVTNHEFQRLKHLPYAKTLFEAGPHGETVVFEVNRKDPYFVEFLIERYLESPLLVKRNCPDYFVWKYRGRLYVLGSPATSLWFEKHQYLRHDKALLDAGPGGETVIFENAPGNPELLERLQATFFSKTAS